jgi:hypothetical protein
LLAGVVSAGVGFALTPILTPAGGIATGVLTYAVLDAGWRYEVEGQTASQSIIGGLGAATGFGGFWTGLTGQDFGTFGDLHLTEGQRWEAGIFGTMQMAMLGFGLYEASILNVSSPASAGIRVTVDAEDTLAVTMMSPDSAVVRNANAIARLRGDAVVMLGNLGTIEKGGLLTLVAHGEETGATIAGLTARQVAGVLDMAGAQPSMIELVVCFAGRRSAQLLANAMDLPVAASTEVVSALRGIVGEPVSVLEVGGVKFPLAPGELWKVYQPQSSVRAFVYEYLRI